MAGDPLYQVAYVSSATRLLSQVDLADLLAQARRNNQALGVSGVLLYADGDFLQVIEGAQTVVEGLYLRIATDPRHRSCIRLYGRQISERSFPDWAMSFHRTNKVELQAEGFEDLFESRAPDTILTGAHALIRAFRQQAIQRGIA